MYDFLTLRCGACSDTCCGVAFILKVLVLAPLHFSG